MKAKGVLNETPTWSVKNIHEHYGENVRKFLFQFQPNCS